MSATLGQQGEGECARPQRADARRNRERIAQAARTVFAEYGSVAQIDLIAKEAGVGVGTVYRHFPTKDALVGELIRDKFREIEVRVRRWADAGGDPWEAFEGMIRDNVEHARGDATQQRLMWEAPQSAFEVAAEDLASLHATSMRLIARAQESGALRADFTPQDIGTFMCALGGCLESRRRGAEGQHPDRLLEIWLEGVRGPGPRPPARS